MSNPIWMPGDGSNTVQTFQENQEFRFYQLQRLLADQGVTDQATFSALAAYLGFSGGGGCTYQDMQVAWTPTNLKLGENIGFFTYGDFADVITQIVFEGTRTIAGIDIEQNSQIQTITAPNLISVDPTNIQGGYLAFKNDSALTTIDFPKIAVVGASIAIADNALLATTNFPKLASVVTGIGIQRCPSLVTMDLSSLSSTQGISIDHNTILATVDLSSLTTLTSDFNCSSCALTVASMENIINALAGIVGYVGHNVNLDGGTNAGLSSLSGTAQAQYAALALANTATINP